MTGRQSPLWLESVQSDQNADAATPSHHVLAPAPGTTWSSYVPRWDPQPTSASISTTAMTDDDSSNFTCLPSSLSLSEVPMQRIGFQNPWPSWHKPSLPQVWQGLEWGEDQDPAISYAMQQVKIEDIDSNNATYSRYSDEPDVSNGDSNETVLPPKLSTAAKTREQQLRSAASRLLRVQEPEFELDPSTSLKATWLGHAGVLLQLSNEGQDPIRILFDPIFSQRCSPSQLAGPIRSYAAPCPVSTLPPIDFVLISHNHYDHLDHDTVKQLWEINRHNLRFIVPLGNKNWFVGKGKRSSGVTEAAVTADLDIPADRVTELDWWDEVLVPSSSSKGAGLKIVCTPAQHGSGRYGVDTNCALWSSWFIEHTTTTKTNKIFFGGDTGCQFHEGDFPPPPRDDVEESDSIDNHTYPTTARFAQYPMCPAFEEIAARLGGPNFLMLPISVGATLSFLRSYIPFPDAYSPFPRVSTGLSSVNHMPPWDAVAVFDRMTKDVSNAVCMAIHWGTFISGPEEVLKTLGQLQWACLEHKVRYARSSDRSGNLEAASKTFVALNHGASTSV